MTRNKSVRDSGIELLRIILMLQVIFLHVCTYGNYSKFALSAGGTHELFYWFIWLMSRCPVYVYIVLMGYFLVEKNMSLNAMKRRVVSTYLVMIFYSLTLPLLAWATGNLESITLSKVVEMFFPLLSRTWYFMSLYIIVLFFAPFLNRGLNSLTKKEYSVLMAGLFFLFSIWTVLANLPMTKEVVQLTKVFSTEEGKGLYGFIYMYLLGGYLKLHVPKKEKAKISYLVLFVALAVLNELLVYQLEGYRKIVGYNDNPISVIQGALLVLYFRDLKIKSTVINKISATNIGVYMIHENPYIRNVIWLTICQLSDLSFYEGRWYPIKIIVVVLLVYIACSFMEMVRKRIFDFFGKRWNKYKLL